MKKDIGWLCLSLGLFGFLIWLPLHQGNVSGVGRSAGAQAPPPHLPRGRANRPEDQGWAEDDSPGSSPQVLGPEADTRPSARVDASSPLSPPLGEDDSTDPIGAGTSLLDLDEMRELDQIGTYRNCSLAYRFYMEWTQ